jgi:hypothetical protein
MGDPISSEKAKPIMARLLKGEVTGFKLYQKVHGYYISFKFDGEIITNKIIITDHAARSGSWSRTDREVQIDRNDYRTTEVKSLAFHQSMLKLLWEKYRLDWKKEGNAVAEAIERRIARDVGISWPAWKLGLEKHSEPMAGPA